MKHVECSSCCCSLIHVCCIYRTAMRHAVNSRTGPRCASAIFPMCNLGLLQNSMPRHLLWCFFYSRTVMWILCVCGRANSMCLTGSTILQCILPHMMIAQHLLALCPSMSCIPQCTSCCQRDHEGMLRVCYEPLKRALARAGLPLADAPGTWTRSFEYSGWSEQPDSSSATLSDFT